MNLLKLIFRSDQPFFNLANEAKRLPHIALSSAVLPLVFLLIAGALTGPLLSNLLFDDFESADAFDKQVFMLFVLFGFMTGLVLLWVRFVESRSISSIGLTSDRFFTNYLSGAISGVVMMSLVVGVMAIFGIVKFETTSAVPTGFDAVGSVSILLFGFIVQGGSEEVLVRGWQFQVIGKRYKPWIGALISSIIFTLLHLGNSGINPIAVFNLMLFSLLMLLYVLKDNSIWSACGWHSAWNWTLGNVYGLSVSGGDTKGGTLINLTSVGPDYITGGNFGPEGSLITSVVLICGSAILVYMINKKRNVSIDEEPVSS